MKQRRRITLVSRWYSAYSLLEFFRSVTNPRSLQIISHGHVRLSSWFKDFVAHFSLLVFFSSLAFRFLTPWKNISFKDRIKNIFALLLVFNNAHINAMCIQVNIYAPLVPPKTCQKYAQNTLGTKTILSRGGREKMFNRGLMNKLMKIEWVSEWVSDRHSSPSETSRMTTSSMS